MKYYDRNKRSPYLQYWNEDNLYGWKMLQKISVINFEWIEDTSPFNEDLTKNYNEESDKEYFLKITWLSQWFTIFTWKNEDWKSGIACS